MLDEVGYPIRAVSRLSGLSSHVIRIWEKRYAAVTPYRTPTNRRLYSEQDIERLVLLRKATLAGHTISTVAGLSANQLTELLSRSSLTGERLSAMTPVELAGILESCLGAIERLDAQSLRSTLVRAIERFGPTAITHDVFIPLLHEIGDRWYDGRLQVRHEHMTSAVVRSILGLIASGFHPAPDSPLLVTATLEGQLHELGALMASIVAAAEEWRFVYLGPNLPPDEIAQSATLARANAVGISLVHPDHDHSSADNLVRLRSLLPNSTHILVGGRAAVHYRRTLDEIGAILVEELKSLPDVLATIRAKSD